MSKLMFLLCFAAATVSGCAAGKPDTLKIAVITDIHYLSPQLAEEGDALTAYERATGRVVSEQHQVLQQVITDLMIESPDILLLTGDLTSHGALQSHLGLIELLRPLQQAGTSLHVIPGNHDVNIPDAKAYKGEHTTPVEGVDGEAFEALYASFGYEGALRRDPHSLSYLAAIDADTWLLAIDSNRYDEKGLSSVTAGRISPQTLAWALTILREAEEREIRVLGMMHHGLVEHMPFQSAFFPDYLVDEWHDRAEQLADAGMQLMFTGHFHSNDISMHTSAADNRIYDVETGSLAQYPFAYRIMQLSDQDLSVDTRFVTSIPDNDHLAEMSLKSMEEITRRVAQQRLKRIGIPFPEETMEMLTGIIVKLHSMHLRGDEKPDREMEMMIGMFATMLGDDADMEAFSFDFPPADNQVVIPLN